jgi:hypothetical protein
LGTRLGGAGLHRQYRYGTDGGMTGLVERVALERAAAEERIQELERALGDMLGQCEHCRSARAVLEKRKQISAAGAGAEQCGDLGGIGGFECDRPKGHAGRHVVERKP